jgi:cell division protein FtsI (penicillin-binding protein 3)
VTHTYSKTLHVASFAGMAPVSNPAITVAVVIDSPTVGSYYGAQVSAPVFQEVAQQVLEYLGVPHDEPVKTAKQMQAATAAAAKDGFGDAPSEPGGDLNAMFAQANELPADDPLRVAMTNGQPAPVDAPVMTAPAAPAPEKKSSGLANLLPAKVVAAFRAKEAGPETIVPAPLSTAKPVVTPPSSNAVVTSAGRLVAVPVFTGEALRQVVEQANSAGLRVQTVGSGIAREQAPVAGTMVPAGTEIVVRFTR